MTNDVPRAARRSWPRRILNRFEVDRSVFYAVCVRAWQVAAGAVTAVLITIFIAPATQGYYYTIASLLMLQTFFELGLGVVVMNQCSHAWVGLQLDAGGRIAGDEAARTRLVSFVQIIMKMFGVMAVIFVVIVGVAGTFFLDRRDDHTIAWFGPWLAAVGFTGLQFWTTPLTTVLESCQQMAVVQKFRLLQAVVSNIVVWIALIRGNGLWALALAAGARWLVDVLLLLLYREFFRPMCRESFRSEIDWRRDVWPMQWRLAIQGLVGYLNYGLFSPVMFHYHGPETAGRMGLTWQLVSAVQMASLTWVSTRVPLLGSLIARGDRQELDRVFRRVVDVSMGVVFSAGLAVVLGTIGLTFTFPRIATRLLEPRETSLFVLGVIALHLPLSQVMYLRAHKKDPTFALNTLACVATGLLVWLLGKAYGPFGAGLAFLGVSAGVMLPGVWITWSLCRKRWSSAKSDSAADSQASAAG